MVSVYITIRKLTGRIFLLLRPLFSLEALIFFFLLLICHDMLVNVSQSSILSVSFNFPKICESTSDLAFFTGKGVCITIKIYFLSITLLLFICGTWLTISYTTVSISALLPTKWWTCMMVRFHLYFFIEFCMPKVQIGTFHYSISFSFIFSFQYQSKISPADQCVIFYLVVKKLKRKKRKYIK